jgi:hypothetical protein
MDKIAAERKLPMKFSSLESPRLDEFYNVLWVRVRTDAGFIGLGETFRNTFVALAGQIHFFSDPGLKAIGVKISDAQLASAVRCRRTISVCTLNPKTENGFNHRFRRFRRFNRLRLDTLEF